MPLNEFCYDFFSRSIVRSKHEKKLETLPPTPEANEQQEYPVKKISTQEYRHITGSILYLANCTRPDLAHAASYLSKYNDKSTHEHWVQAKHVLTYLRRTTNYNLNFEKTGKPIDFYVDADFAFFSRFRFRYEKAVLCLLKTQQLF